jgi:hypothetical protein
MKKWIENIVLVAAVIVVVLGISHFIADRRTRANQSELLRWLADNHVAVSNCMSRCGASWGFENGVRDIEVVSTNYANAQSAVLELETLGVPCRVTPILEVKDPRVFFSLWGTSDAPPRMRGPSIEAMLASSNAPPQLIDVLTEMKQKMDSNKKVDPID